MIDITSLLCLIRSILMANCSLDVEDGLAQLNDVFEAHDIERIPRVEHYFSGNTDTGADSDEPEDYELVIVDSDTFYCPLEAQAFKAGLLRAQYGAWWDTLENVDKAYLARNPDNHDLFSHLSERRKRELLREEYDEYRNCRTGPASTQIDLDVNEFAAQLSEAAQGREVMLTIVYDTVGAGAGGEHFVPSNDNIICDNGDEPQMIIRAYRWDDLWYRIGEYETGLGVNDSDRPVVNKLKELRNELSRLGVRVIG